MSSVIYNSTQLSHAVIILIIATISPTISFGQNSEVGDCPEDPSFVLAEGERLFDLIQFAEVINRLTPCLDNKAYRSTQNDSAHRLVILSHLEQEREDLAVIWIKNLLKNNRVYIAQPLDPALFQQLLDEHRPKVWYRRWAFRGPVLGAAVITGAYFALRDTSPDPLPLPPPAPGNN